MKLCAVALAALLPAVAGVPDIDPGKALGNPTAPVTVQVFSDYECPSCKLFHDNTLPEIVRDYVSTGRVYLVYRDFPLPMHRYSREAANYACAAAHLSLYQPVADALFKNQTSWSNTGKVWEVVASVLTASQQKKVQAMAASPQVLGEIQRDLDAGHKEEVNSTPTLIVSRGDKKFPVSGGMNYVLLRKLIDDLSK
ncbi:MAG TPA: thioredoxin domain-containing protein [Bryobacteraceae bacterium]|nr:thioredoxin domain-containing protein [Bryobacteraceae bacterium]